MPVNLQFRGIELDAYGVSFSDPQNRTQKPDPQNRTQIIVNINFMKVIPSGKFFKFDQVNISMRFLKFVFLIFIRYSQFENHKVMIKVRIYWLTKKNIPQNTTAIHLIQLSDTHYPPIITLRLEKRAIWRHLVVEFNLSLTNTKEVR